MRRIASLTVLAAAVPVLLVGCDDSAPAVDARDTVEVGTLPSELPTTAASVVATTDVTTTADATVPSSEPPSRADPSSTTDDAPTRFVEVLAGLVEGEIPAQVPSTTLRDETGRLRVAVPREWTDRRAEPAVLADGSETPSLGAAPDLTSFLDGYDTPGLTALVVTEEPAAALDAYAFDEDCLNRRRGAYRSPGLAGRYEVWESCGGTLNDIVTIAVRPDETEESVLLLVQIIGPEDLVALDAALASLDLRA